MNIDLTQYTIEEIVSLKEKCIEYIYEYVDGYEYICRIRSYGRFWTENVNNKYRLQELCYQYDGGDGIGDVYTTNPNMSDLYNYGCVYFIPSVNDYNKWREYEDLNKMVKEIEKILEDWDNRDNVPFEHKPLFKPYFTQEDLLDYKKRIDEYDMSFVSPTLIKKAI